MAREPQPTWLLQLFWGSPPGRGALFLSCARGEPLLPYSLSQSHIQPATRHSGTLGFCIPSCSRHPVRARRSLTPGAHLEAGPAGPPPALGEQTASCCPRGMKVLPNLVRGAARRMVCVCLTAADFGAGWGDARSCLSSCYRLGVDIHGASGMQTGDDSGFTAGLVPS